MNSRGSWSVDGIEPSVRERAEAAARRAGMSLNDWLNSTVGGSPMPDFRTAQPPAANQGAPDVTDIHQRLDSITRQIDQLSSPARQGEPAVARQLNDAISRLDARLARITTPAPAQRAPEDTQRRADRVERAAAEIYNSSPPLNPASLEFAIAEITARQHELDSARAAPVRNAPPIAPAMTPAPVAPDFSGLERQLFNITSQIESLRCPDGIEQSVAAFRSELAEIRHAITEAMPRHAMESIENEIRSLARRIEDSRQSGSDGQTLANIERALNEIYDALRSLKPAEQLAGFDDAIRNLGAKVDTIVRSSGDSGTVQQLESAIGALRGIVSNVASNDALARLSDDLNMLSSKVDQLGRLDGRGDSFAALEQRIAALTTTLETREPLPAAGNSEQLEGAVRALSERLDQLPVGHDSSSALAHLEQRVSLLLERLETTSGHGAGNLGRVEEGLQDILRHLERQQAGLAALTEAGPRGIGPSVDSDVVDAIKRELSEMRFNQSETTRHTQDSLEVVHNTLGHVVDRLAMIEGDLRAVRSAPAPAAPPRAAMPQQPVSPRPELPNPVLLQTAVMPPSARAAAPAPQRTLSDALIQKDTFSADHDALATPRPQPSQAAIDPELPPDHPLEPGTRPPGRGASPSERIAASESALGDIAGAAREQTSSSSFIAAARRAAQAAAAASQSPDKPGRSKVAIETPRPAGSGGSNITSKIRSLLVGASVVVIVLGGFKFAMSLLDGVSPAAVSQTGRAAPSATKPPADTKAKPATPAPASAMPSMTSPTPINQQSMNVPAPASVPAKAEPAAASATPPDTASADITGTIPDVPAALPDGHAFATVAVPPSEKLPNSIGGPVLRAAALHGDATAAYEIAVRYAEGKGVAANYGEAAKWYDRAAQAGVVPAMFRLGTLNEKGLGVSKNIDAARRYYMQAAERGNAKAMHNLAVLDADGGGKGPNYKSAAHWFRKAAERGIADSQFNLGILYARGIGVEQNLAESYKWFSLAAAQGDADSGRKRDDVAKRLDPQSLAAAKLAIQTFSPERQPADAVKVASPAGGWDAAPAKPAAKTSAARHGATKRAAR
jgi:localization factor PodJL